MNSTSENTEYYQILGISPRSSIDEVKKAYNKQVKTMHPDKGGNPEEFVKLQSAYEILSNEKTKEIYDKYGEQGLKQRRQGEERNEYKKAKPLKIQLEVTLEDVFNGKMIKPKIPVKQICGACKGLGGINQQICSKCNGQKVLRIAIQIAPGIYTQQMMGCDQCKTRGTIMAQQDICGSCNGDCIIDIMKQVDVPIEKGVPHDYNYEITGQGHEAPGYNAGDIIAVIKIKDHPLFERIGADLYINKIITLKEALTGFSFSVNHLSGEEIWVGCISGEIVAPSQFISFYILQDETMMLTNKGMPFFKDPLNFGNLYIKFEIEFPKIKELSATVIEQLIHALPGNIQSISNESDTLELEEYQKEHENPSPQGGQKEEQDPQESQKVQCAQQ